MNAIVPSVSLAECGEGVWDALVIGAGCAGTVAARELARTSARVLLVDKARFPRYKVCGCCLGRPAQHALAAIGLGGLLAREGAVTVRSFDLRAGRAHATVPLPGYAVLSRERLDAALVDAAIAVGTAFLPGTQASLRSSSGDARCVQLRQEGAIAAANARIVIIADGLGSRLLRATDDFDSPPEATSRIGMGAVSVAAPTDYRPGTIYMACGTQGYVGAARREDGRLAIAAACDGALVKSSGGLSRAAAAVLDEAGYPAVPDIHEIEWKGTPALTRSATAVAAHRAFVVGDAAGYVEPFTGEGMKWAIESAIALAPIACSAIVKYDSRCEREWAAARQRIVAHRTAVCRALAASLRHPALVKTALRVLAVAPAAAAPFVRRLNAPQPAQKEVVL